MFHLAAITGAVSDSSEAAPSFWWAAPACTLFAAIGAGIFAFLAIRANRQMIRLRASLDMVERIESSDYYNKMIKGWKAAKDKNFQSLTEEERIDALSYLNHHEIIAIGIKNGVLDKQFFADWKKTSFVKNWRIAKPFVETIRNPPGQPQLAKLFIQYEQLASEWEKDVA